MHSLRSEAFWNRLYDVVNRNVGSDVVLPTHEIEPKSRKLQYLQCYLIIAHALDSICCNTPNSEKLSITSCSNDQAH